MGIRERFRSAEFEESEQRSRSVLMLESSFRGDPRAARGAEVVVAQQSGSSGACRGNREPDSRRSLAPGFPDEVHKQRNQQQKPFKGASPAQQNRPCDQQRRISQGRAASSSQPAHGTHGERAAERRDCAAPVGIHPVTGNRHGNGKGPRQQGPRRGKPRKGGPKGCSRHESAAQPNTGPRDSGEHLARGQKQSLSGEELGEVPGNA